MTSVLLVCAANLCRSPMAEVVFRARAPLLGLQQIASAGVWAASRPQPMDPRAVAALQRRGYKPERRWHSRRVQPLDFSRYELVLAMDQEVLDGLHKSRPAHCAAELGLFLGGRFASPPQEVPDPYYGSAQGFDRVLDLIEARSSHWLQHGP
ncbi:low molecular weight phosphotyrosine protein phosphatase [Pelomonas sp. CA6]|uniref:low molecular weight protein-tyrosine-phosphatase n=1 Tax=Pelomonas sp. CA6 TaxID=2907999 RepID=UPI001F4B55AA|nr:low molecular weight phosphotyrosine protein phosphatase [Pelomonas sp. CA6]MCH7342942.1 low molecular weight phosphotyrosine protein phosphatase [Pelomonas sp. CA6]